MLMVTDKKALRSLRLLNFSSLLLMVKSVGENRNNKEVG